MQFRTAGKDTLGLKIKKQKVLDAIIISKLEIKNLEKIRNFLFTYYLCWLEVVMFKYFMFPRLKNYCKQNFSHGETLSFRVSCNTLSVRAFTVILSTCRKESWLSLFCKLLGSGPRLLLFSRFSGSLKVTL